MLAVVGLRAGQLASRLSWKIPKHYCQCTYYTNKKHQKQGQINDEGNLRVTQTLYTYKLVLLLLHIYYSTQYDITVRKLTYLLHNVLLSNTTDAGPPFSLYITTRDARLLPVLACLRARMCGRRRRHACATSNIIAAYISQRIVLLLSFIVKSGCGNSWIEKSLKSLLEQLKCNSLRGCAISDFLSSPKEPNITEPIHTRICLKSVDIF